MELVQRSHHPIQNIHQNERIASVIAGAALGIFGIREVVNRHSIPGAGLVLAGATLVKRGITGYCNLYRSFGINTASERGSNASIAYQQGVRVDRSTTVNASPEQLYRFWRDLQNLPRFMKHVQSIRQIDDRRSHWVVEGPAGQRVEWDAEIISDVPNELLGWRSLPGASVNNAGSVRFEPAAGGRGTKVSVSLQYDPPAGPVGVLIAKLFGKEPEQQVEEELHRLKNIVEAGEIPTSAGQPTGRAAERVEQVGQKTRKTEAVHDASEASFPASDPPAYTHVNGQ